MRVSETERTTRLTVAAGDGVAAYPATTPARLPESTAPPVSPPSAAWLATKRALDVTMAVLTLLAILPVLLLIALAVKLDSPGPVLFRQVRCGRQRKPFVMFKFRTMSHGASETAHREYIAHLASGGDEGEGLERAWTVEQDRLAALLPDARHVIAHESEHYIQLQQPALVIEAVREVVAAVRDPATWATPAATP